MGGGGERGRGGGEGGGRGGNFKKCILLDQKTLNQQKKRQNKQ